MPLAAMVDRVAVFRNALQFDGLDQYLTSDDGDDLERLAADSQEMGALRTVELVAATLDLFPAGTRGSADRRSARLAALSEHGDADPTRALGIAHWDVLRELPARFHEYVVRHLEEFEETLCRTRAARNPGVGHGVPTDVATGGIDIAAQFHEAAQTVKRFRSLAPASKARPFPPHTPDLTVGTILEIRDESANHAALTFVQVTHHHDLEPMFGPVVRVIEGWYDTRPSTIDDVAERATRIVGLLPNEISPARIATIVGVYPVPAPDQVFPAFRSICGTSVEGQLRWGIWQGGSRSIAWYTEPLPAEVAQYPILGPPRPVQQLIR